MSIELLYPLVTEAIRRAETLEDLGAPGVYKAYLDVSFLEEKVTEILPTSSPEGALARRGAVRAALTAREFSRAQQLAERFLAEAGIEAELTADLLGLLKQVERSTAASTLNSEPRRTRERTTIGPLIIIKGDLSGSEDLVIDGRVEGRVDLKQHSVTVGRNGRVKADIFGRMVTVEGEVDGNVFAQEQAILRQSGAIHGNISAPRVILEDGSRFKGSIDMEAHGSSRIKPPQSADTVRTQAGEAAASAAKIRWSEEGSG